eukprot:CAMPEP_0172916148 /NCGR_PEP_ID=MMETSP1075-20121228/195750_1 /TAXON_ID=2916 /ORGANISM="Ceratium fusus, Strain PA161109" /LENGTH=86 /DNA_ID=CAMNT_0013775387 /DNA_START=11 /DNA_END=268 /DNA_ORIENTATION=+
MSHARPKPGVPRAPSEEDRGSAVATCGLVQAFGFSKRNAASDAASRPKSNAKAQVDWVRTIGELRVSGLRLPSNGAVSVPAPSHMW